jgi:hypothetical protein
VLASRIILEPDTPSPFIQLPVALNYAEPTFNIVSDRLIYRPDNTNPVTDLEPVTHALGNVRVYQALHQCPVKYRTNGADMPVEGVRVGS